MVEVISVIFSLLTELIIGIIGGVFNLGMQLFTKQEKNGYSAEFVPITNITSRWNKGICLVGGLRATTKDIAYRNCLVVGPSGSGKTSTVILGSLATLARGNFSMCVMDVSGEIYRLMSGFLAKLGYVIYCINFGPNSDGFNPLAFCKDVNDIHKTAFLLVKNSNVESKSDPYWSSSAEMMLSVFMEYLVFFTEPKYRTMANLVAITDMFAADPKKIDLLIVKTHSEGLLTKYKAMNAVSERTLQSTIATVRTALKVFSTPAIQKATAVNTVDFASFRKKKSVLFICTPLNDVNYYAPISALLFEALFKEIMSRIPKKHELSIYCLIDEMVTMKYQNPGVVWSNIRKHRAGCMGLIQDEKMLQMNMSPAESYAIKSNSYCKVFLPGQGLDTCKQLEEILGKRTYTDEKGIERTRLLMSASEIRMCKEAIVLCGNEPPMKAKLRPFYEHWQLSRMAKLPPYKPALRPDFEVPILPFNEA